MKKIAAVVGVLAVVGIGAFLYIDHRIHNQVDAYLQAQVDRGAYDAYSYGDLSYSLGGQASIQDLLITYDGVDLLFKEVRVNDLDYSNEIPQHMDITLDGMQLPNGGLSDLGMEPDESMAMVNQWLFEGEVIPVLANYRYDYEPENEHNLDAHMDITLTDYGMLSFSTLMRNLPMDEMNALNESMANDPMAAQGQAMQLLNRAEIPRVEINIRDMGMVQKYIDTSASTMGAEPDQVRNMLIGQAQNAYLFAPQMVQSLAMDAGQQVASFLEGGKTLRLTLAPDFEGSVQQLQPQIMGAMFTGDINTVVDLLNLELVAE